MTHETFDPQKIADLKAALDAAPALNPQISKAEVVRQLAPAIKELRGKGYTVQDVVDLLKSNGFDINLGTFRTLLKANGDKRTLSAAPAPAAPGAGPATSSA